MSKQNKAQNILDMIRDRQTPNYRTHHRFVKTKLGTAPAKHQWRPVTEPTKVAPSTPLSADEWQKFKRDFVEEYGGEPVQLTGMTHSDFIRYLTDGTRESGKRKSLKELLKDLKK